MSSDRLVWRRNQYHDDKGHTIIEREVIQGTPPADFERYFGQGEIAVELSNGQKLTRAIRVTLPRARTVKEAFKQIDDEARRQQPAAVDAFLKELGVGQIATPTPGQANRILRGPGPNGGPRRRPGI
jgi:hypothetical protein